MADGEIAAEDQGEDMDAMYDLLAEHLDGKLQAPKGFMLGLLHEDDWSFVIKSHALVESAVSRMLSLALDERLRASFKKLGLRQKLEFAKSLDMLNANEIALVDMISAIRNKLAHDSSYLAWTLEAHVEGLEPSQRESFYVRLTTGVEEDKTSEWRQFLVQQPKAALYSRIILIVVKALQVGDFAVIERTEGADALKKLLAGQLVPPDFEKYVR
jgi:hypothetical protein